MLLDSFFVFHGNHCIRHMLLSICIVSTLQN